MNEFGAASFCSPVCQHPSCWSSQRKAAKGLCQGCSSSTKGPSFQDRSNAAADESGDDEGLPTQSVVNLLDDYGYDPHDRYPSKYSGRPTHERNNTLSAMTRAWIIESAPKTRAPNATPASFLASTDKLGHLDGHKGSFVNRIPRVGKVEVQEVFDPADLNSDWQDTFKAKKFYVWMPGKMDAPEKMPHKSKYHLGASKPRKIKMKDVTEDMVPLDVELEREASKTLTFQWPVLKYRPIRSPHSFFDPDFVEPYPRERIARHEKYFGVYELLDLPKDVLVQVMQHVNERDMLDPHRFAHALMTALPKIEKKSSSLSLASSDVLRQKKLKLHDGRLKVHREPFPESKQIVILDKDLLEQLTASNRPTPNAPEFRHPFEPPPHHPMNQQHETFPLKQPLPSISGKREHVNPSKGHLPSIALGLPEVPRSDVGRNIKPFTYANTGQDFTLGRISSPSMVNRTDESRRLSESRESTDHNSTLHVTMPTVRSEIPEDSSHHPSKTDIPGTPLHAVSPTISTNVPKTPLATPATRGTYGSDLMGNTKPSSLGASPCGRSPTIRPLSQPDLTDPVSQVILHTIPEAEQEFTPRDPHNRKRSVGSEREGIKSVHSSQNTTGAVRGASEAPPLRERDEALGHKSLPPSRENLVGSGGVTPEPWPEVDEDKYNQTPTPPPAVQRASTASTFRGMDASLLANADVKSEKSGLTSMMDHPTFSRESNKHSAKAKQLLMQDPLPGSPAPPPPSPNPTGPTTDHGPINIEELIDSSSEFTITAPPPSDLDDLSRINTPAESTRAAAITRPSQEGALRHPLLDTEYSIVEETAKAEDEAKGTSPGKQVVENQDMSLNVNINQLDQFDATEETFKEELQAEYEKLSAEGEANQS